MENKRTPGMFGGYYNEDGKLEGFTPSHEFKSNYNWSKEPNIVEPYSMVKHTGGLILSGIIIFILFEIFLAISYLIDLVKQ